MSRDILSDATQALREEREVDAAIAERRAEVTRDRIVTSLTAERPRRRRSLFMVPLAAILIGSTAWASGVLPAAWEALSSDDEPNEQPVVMVAPSSTEPVTPPSPIAPPAPVDTEVEDEDTVVENEPESTDVAPSATPSVAPSAPAAAPDPAAELYRAAHDAHFSANNPSLALQRWNEYLAKAPSGRFAPEAAYNRALCLVRLGQHDAAKTALAPFANGSYGGYRQAEAKQLVDALTRKAANDE